AGAACSEPPPAGAAPAAQFTVDSGGVIHAPDVSVFTPVGANVGVLGGFNHSGDARGQSAWAAGWKWNTIRLDIYPSDLFGPYAGANYDETIQVINEYT